MSYATAVDGQRYEIDRQLRAKYRTKSMPHECLPEEVTDMTVSRELIAGQLDADRELLKLRYSLNVIPDDSPPDATELAVLDGEKRLNTIDRQITRLLKGC